MKFGRYEAGYSRYLVNDLHLRYYYRVMEIFESYKTLGLPPDASDEDAKHAYRKLVNRWHPDRFVRNDALQQLAEEHLKLFNIAYAEIKKHLAARPHRYRPRTGQTTRVSPGFRQRRSPGAGPVPAVLNRLTRKFRQMFSSWMVTPQRPVRVRTRPGSPPASGPSPSVGKTPVRRRAAAVKNFDEVFKEVAGPEAARMKRAAARKKRGRLKRTSRPSTASSPIIPDSGKSRENNTPVVTPVSRIKRVGKIRPI